MKRLLLVCLLIVGVFTTTILLTAEAAEQNPFENNIIMCTSNGAPLMKLSNIQTYPQSNANACLPVPQIGATLEVADSTVKVTNVEYIYGSVSIYCIKVYVEPIK